MYSEFFGAKFGVAFIDAPPALTISQFFKIPIKVFLNAFSKTFPKMMACIF